MLRNTKRLDGQIFTIELPSDENGMIGRQCPNENCNGFFKVKPGTGMADKSVRLKCPYCGTAGENDDFATPEQLEFARSVVLQEVQKAIGADLRSWGKDLERSFGGGFVQVKTEYKSNPLPIHLYQEKALETRVVCQRCELEYSIFGKFSFCPDCGDDNALQILQANLELIQKVVSKALTEDDHEFREYLLRDALENVVSSFDSFGRNIIRLHTRNSDTGQMEISFQNIGRARKRINDEFGFDFGSGLAEDNWQGVISCFEKRHLIAHNEGIVDERYLKITCDTAMELGKEITISSADVTKLAIMIELISRKLISGLRNWKAN